MGRGRPIIGRAALDFKRLEKYGVDRHAATSIALS
jgi:hypothetical protein